MISSDRRQPNPGEERERAARIEPGLNWDCALELWALPHAARAPLAAVDDGPPFPVVGSKDLPGRTDHLVLPGDDRRQDLLFALRYTGRIRLLR
jgi:hypothetical protein